MFSVAQALPGWAGQGSEFLKFDPAGSKPSFLFLGKHAWDSHPATVIHLTLGSSLSFYSIKVGTGHQGWSQADSTFKAPDQQSFALNALGTGQCLPAPGPQGSF